MAVNMAVLSSLIFCIQKIGTSLRGADAFLLKLQKIGVYRLNHKGVGPEAGLDVHLGIGHGIFRGEGHLHILAFAAHAHSAVDIVGAVGYGEAEQFPVADAAHFHAVDINTETTGDAIRGTLAVEVEAGILGQKDLLVTFGTLGHTLGQVDGLPAMGANDTNFCRHDSSSDQKYFLLTW